MILVFSCSSYVYSQRVSVKTTAALEEARCSYNPATEKPTNLHIQNDAIVPVDIYWKATSCSFVYQFTMQVGQQRDIMEATDKSIYFGVDSGTGEVLSIFDTNPEADIYWTINGGNPITSGSPPPPPGSATPQDDGESLAPGLDGGVPSSPGTTNPSESEDGNPNANGPQGIQAGSVGESSNGNTLVDGSNGTPGESTETTTGSSSSSSSSETDEPSSKSGNQDNNNRNSNNPNSSMVILAAASAGVACIACIFLGTMYFKRLKSPSVLPMASSINTSSREGGDFKNSSSSSKDTLYTVSSTGNTTTSSTNHNDLNSGSGNQPFKNKTLYYVGNVNVPSPPPHIFSTSLDKSEDQFSVSYSVCTSNTTPNTKDEYNDTLAERESIGYSNSKLRSPPQGNLPPPPPILQVTSLQQVLVPTIKVDNTTSNTNNSVIVGGRRRGSYSSTIQNFFQQHHHDDDDGSEKKRGLSDISRNGSSSIDYSVYSGQTATTTQSTVNGSLWEKSFYQKKGGCFGDGIKEEVVEDVDSSDGCLGYSVQSGFSCDDNDVVSREDDCSPTGSVSGSSSSLGYSVQSGFS